MSNYELQMLVTALHYDCATAAAVRDDIETHPPGEDSSHLQYGVNNPLDSGIDEG